MWKNILHNILSNEWELKVVYQQIFNAGRKYFFLEKVFFIEFRF